MKEQKLLIDYSNLLNHLFKKTNTANVKISKPIMRVDTKHRENVIIDVNNKLSEFNRDIIDDEI